MNQNSAEEFDVELTMYWDEETLENQQKHPQTELPPPQILGMSPNDIGRGSSPGRCQIQTLPYER